MVKLELCARALVATIEATGEPVNNPLLAVDHSVFGELCREYLPGKSKAHLCLQQVPTMASMDAKTNWFLIFLRYAEIHIELYKKQIESTVHKLESDVSASNERVKRLEDDLRQARDQSKHLAEHLVDLKCPHADSYNKQKK